MSPLPLAPTPPTRASPTVARCASRRHWCGSSGASVATTTMIEPALGRRGAAAATAPRRSGSRRPTGTPSIAQQIAPAVVGLDQHADRPAAALRRQDARGGADAALELVADHPGAAADAALGDRAARGRVERGEDVLRPDVQAVDVVQPAVVGLGDDRQAPGRLVGRVAARDVVGDQRVADDADAVGVGDRDRRRQQPRLLDPGQCRSSRRCR